MYMYITRKGILQTLKMINDRPVVLFETKPIMDLPMWVT